jgi:endonuclease/exonuclease/phosphatase (EEP) superfamily protein YafD
MTWPGVRRWLGRAAIAATAAVALTEWVLMILRPESGPLGVLEVFTPHLALLGIALIPFTFLDRRRAAAISAVALVVVTVARFGGDWISLPVGAPPDGTVRIEVETWNLETDARPPADTVAALKQTAADVVGLQELQDETAAAITSDAELAARYPYHAFAPRPGVLGLGLLSRFPISDATYKTNPAFQEMSLDLGAGRRLAILNSHPLHASVSGLGRSRLPIGLDVARRNQDLVEIRSRIEARIAAGWPVVLLGDLNTASSEPAFDRLTRGLRDVHAEAGFGPGWTWRPIRLEFLGIGLIRIDHVIVSPTILPLAIGEVCPAIGDHCLVRAAIGLPGSAASARASTLRATPT